MLLRWRCIGGCDLESDTSVSPSRVAEGKVLTVSEAIERQIKEFLSRSIHSIQWSTKTAGALRRARIATLHDLVCHWNSGLFKELDYSMRYEIETLLFNQRKSNLLSPEVQRPLVKSSWFRQSERRPLPVSRPSRLGEYILYLFLPAEYRDCLLGDLRERYSLIPQHCGANRWYWRQILLTLCSIFKTRLQRASGWDRLADAFRRIRQ